MTVPTPLIEQSVVCPILVGRDAALAAVRHTLDRAHATHGGTLLVSGEAGIGKSRLVRDLVTRARTLGFVTLHGACFEADRAQPYAPILDLVRVLAATASSALAAHYFAPAASELVTLFPELRSMFPNARVEQMRDPEEQRRRLFHSFADAMRALGRAQPLVLVIEDVHWSDDATLELMQHLARGIVTEPIALIMTFRSDELGPRLARLLADFDRARCASEIALRPLAATDVSAMLQAIFGGQFAFDPSFIGGLHGLTEGNPFFVEEMLKALVMAGDLQRADGAWRARPLERIRVPRTATEAVGRRLAALSSAACNVAAVAAVAGRRFDFGLLQAMTGHGDAELLALIKELVEAQLVVEETAERFAFRHALTREAMQARLLARERIALHRSIAAVLEQSQSIDGHDADEALAYHTFEAGDWEAARRYALRAAEHASALCAPREALQQLERAVTATERSAVRQGVDAELLIARGRTHETLGAFSQAQDDFAAALAAARTRSDRRAEWLSLHALGLLWAARDYERAGGYRRDALDVARVIGDPLLVARSLNRVGNWYVNREDPQSGIPYHTEALEIFEQNADRAGVAETLDLLAMAHHIAAAHDAAVEFFDRSIALFTELENRRGLANALAVIRMSGPTHHSSAGPVCTSAHVRALSTDEGAVNLTVKIGWRAGEAFARLNLADCLAWRGEYARALRTAREALAIAEEIDHLEWQCGAGQVLGAIALDLCAPLEAVAHLEAAHDIARRLGSATWLRWTGAPLAIAYAQAGRHDASSVVIRDIDRALPRSVAASGAVSPRTLGERYLALAEAEAALAADAPSLVLDRLAERHAVGAPRVGFVRARALARLERWDEAAEALDRSRDAALIQEARGFLWRIDALQGTVHLGQRHRVDARRAFDAARRTAFELAAGVDDAGLLAAFRAGVDSLAPPARRPTAGQAAKMTHGGLTRRERDAAALVAQGKSNRAIARMLGIGERTVEGHVAAALAKLGFASRAQLAVWATEQGLSSPEASTGRSGREPDARQS